ncbi:MAG: acyl-CoA dehydrogenase family protein [Acidimicrobiales bacterium]
MRRHPAAVTPAGERACALAEALAAEWAPGAGERDRRARFDPHLLDGVRRGGLAGCCVPADLGGLGVDQLRDVMAVVHRLAAADGSLALVVHMHLSSSWSLARARDEARAPLLADIARGRAWLCAAVTEAGTNFFHPRATLQAAAGGGWVLDGTKVFATGSPAATHFSVNARVVGGAHDNRLAQAIVPAETAGITVVDDWDGLGMRASGSGVVRFEQVSLPPGALVSPGGPYGVLSPAALCGRAFGNVGNVTAMAGIATAACELALQRATGATRVGAQPLAERATVRHGLAQLLTDRFALEAVVDALGARADEVAGAAGAGAPIDEPTARAFMADFQTAKLNVNRLSEAVVDRALSLAGGSGYTGASPLSRLVRDVRAGQFMQPFSPHEALGFVGAVAVGAEPDVEA